MACNSEAILRSRIVSHRVSSRPSLPGPPSVILSEVRRTPNGVEGPRVRCDRPQPSLIFSSHEGRSGAASLDPLGSKLGTVFVSVFLVLFVPASIFAQQSRNKFDDHIQAFVRNGDFSGS